MRILVVEDERLLCDGIAEDLELEKYTVDRCYDGADAHERLFVEPYDLVILDLNLPGMDGLELLRRIRSERPELRVLILSARAQLSDKVAGLDLGADDYLVKPFAFEELLARIRAALRKRSSARAGAVLSAGPLEMDVDKHSVTVKGQGVELTKKEFDLLHHLLENKGRVLSREALLDSVWGFDFVGETNSVDVYIRFLRSKIDEAFGIKLIHTVRGVGYVIRED